ncbi:hypothetical protein FPRO06_10131 [Fusarium proliferatum]|nr:hypothetical protein FPRO06_10131 [Fusarium proliferatum]
MNNVFTTCSTTVCMLQKKKALVNCEKAIDGCKKLSDQDVEPLAKLESLQSYTWQSDDAYRSDRIVLELYGEIRVAYQRLLAECQAASPTPTATTTSPDTQKEIHDLAEQNLRVHINISNSLRGLFEIQHRRQAHREAAAGNASALAQIDADNFPLIPPRVGPSTLPRSIGITHLVDSEDDEEPNNSETAKAAGKKRAAPDGSGQTATGKKKPKTK